MNTMVELKDVQGIIIRGYGKMPFAAFLLVQINDPGGAKSWLKDIAGEITHAEADLDQLDTCMNIAFTNTGVIELGLKPEVMNTFSREFEEGMTTDHRRRILGDFGKSDPSTWDWGGPGDTKAIHMIVLCYGKTADALQQLINNQKSRWNGLELVRQLDTILLPDRKEHFGFRDGIAQPVIKDAGRDESGHPANNINPGEFLFGYKNEYDKYTVSPNVDPDMDPQNILHADQNFPDKKDLGRNGSMLVFRQLEQDVRKFWTTIDQAVKSQQVDNTSSTIEHLGAKMVGRWPSGAPLTKCPFEDDPSKRDFDNFGYAEKDYDGYKCPIGSHIRRTNPRDNFLRDSTGKPEKDIKNSEKFMKRFRIIRRGRAYGKPVSPNMDPHEVLRSSVEDTDRGLHFLCFNANIGRQFELIQQTWVNNPKFAGLYEDPDPIMGFPEIMGAGATTTFTEQAAPVRKKVTGIPQFVHVKGGAYFFMPGIRGIEFLASLP